MCPRKVLHIGGHTGEEAEVYRDNGVDHVIWFEANDALIPQLQNHISIYSQDMSQQIIPYGLWNTDKSLKFNFNKNSQCSSFLELGTHLEKYPMFTVTEEKFIQVYRLDTLLDNNKNEHKLLFDDFEFINLDVQGGELAILEGFGKYIASDSIKGIYLEVNTEELYKGCPLISDLDNFLAPFGFARLVTEITREKWGDALYIKTLHKQH
jgi:FkbM family methyltransferase